jgi:MFS family permease
VSAMPPIGPRRAQPGDALPPVVVALGAVSFCTDVAGEMIVPLLPVFLASLGGSHLALGVLQGLSDLVVAGLKLASGWISDRQERRRPWILFGYSLSAVLRPLYAVVASPWAAVAVRTADRVGKGLRQAPRDALLADAVPPHARGRAFGLVRALDHGGALAGSLAAFALVASGFREREVFAFALVPGLVGVVLLAVFVKETARDATMRPSGNGAGDLRRLLPFLVVVAFAACGAGIDLFLLALASELGATPAQLPLLWALLHVVRSGLAARMGALSDRLGRRRVIAWGLAAQTLVLAAFALVDSLAWMWPLFALHGLHAAFADGAERGYVADLAGKDRRGTAYGVYHAVQGIAAFVAPIAVGWTWDEHGAGPSLALASATSLIAIVALFALVRDDAPLPTRAR